MNKSDVMELIGKGENSSVEFKSYIINSESFTREVQQNGVFHYVANAVDASSYELLDSTQLSTYFNRYSLEYSLLSDDEKVRTLTNSDILTVEGEVTVGGLLLFGTYPQKNLRMASIAFAHFAGDTLDESLIDKQIIEGTLPRQVDTVLAIIKNSIRKPSVINGAKRVEKAALPDKVFRELLVNACCHRNYSIVGSQIRVFIFDNRIEFISPGRLPNTISVEKLPYGVSYAVNPIIVKFMENLGYIDKLGRGLPMVKQECDKLGVKVEFIEFGEEFKVIVGL